MKRYKVELVLLSNDGTWRGCTAFTMANTPSQAEKTVITSARNQDENMRLPYIVATDVQELGSYKIASKEEIAEAETEVKIWLQEGCRFEDVNTNVLVEYILNKNGKTCF